MAPIHVAAARGDADTLDRLLEANTITTLKTRDGLTALDIAKAKGHESIYSRLMRSRKPINSRNTLSNPVLAEPAPSSSARENLPSLSNTLQQALQSPASGDTLPPAISTISNSSTSNRSSSANRRKPGGSNMGQTTPSSSSSSAMNYSIMGESTTSSTGSMEESIALKKLLESEISKRKKVESKVRWS